MVSMSPAAMSDGLGELRTLNKSRLLHLIKTLQKTKVARLNPQQNSQGHCVSAFLGGGILQVVRTSPTSTALEETPS